MLPRPPTISTRAPGRAARRPRVCSCPTRDWRSTAAKEVFHVIRVQAGCDGLRRGGRRSSFPPAPGESGQVLLVFYLHDLLDDPPPLRQQPTNCLVDAVDLLPESLDADAGMPSSGGSDSSRLSSPFVHHMIFQVIPATASRQKCQ